jgi:hypothetical protein
MFIFTSNIFVLLVLYLNIMNIKIIKINFPSTQYRHRRLMVKLLKFLFRSSNVFHFVSELTDEVFFIERFRILIYIEL